MHQEMQKPYGGNVIFSGINNYIWCLAAKNVSFEGHTQFIMVLRDS